MAAEAVLRAGAIQRARYGRTIEIEHKGEIDLVTEVDRACETAILEVLRARFPDHDIVTEETDLARTRLALRLVRRSPRRHHELRPRLSRSSALGGPAVDGEVVAGAVYDPLKDELFTAERGAGAHLNGRRLRVSPARRAAATACSSPASPTTCATTSPASCACSTASWARRAPIRRDGAAALDLCYVAAGRVDGFWEERLQPWDMMAGKLMVEEAGGRVSRFDGAPLGLAPTSWSRPGPGCTPGCWRCSRARPCATVGRAPEWRNWQTRGT